MWKGILKCLCHMLSSVKLMLPLEVYLPDIYAEVWTHGPVIEEWYINS